MTSENNIPIFPQRKNNITNFQMICVLLNIAIGTGWVKLGYGWRCGILLSSAITIGFALLSYYAIWFYLKTIDLTKKGVFEQIWAVLFNKWSSYIVLTFSIIVTVSCVMFYIQFIAEYSITLFQTLLKDIIPNYISNFTVFGLIITLLFVFPSSFIQKLKTLAVISYVQLISAFVILVGAIYFLIEKINTIGFDPNHELKLYSFDKYSIACVNALLTAYLIVPLAWPSPEHVKNATFNSLKHDFQIVFVVLTLFYIAAGLISYLTFYDNNEGDLLLNLYPTNTLSLIMKFALIISLILSCPVLFNHGRKLVIYSIIGSAKNNDSAAWVCIGFLISILAYVFGTIPGGWFDLICFISDTANPVLLFIVPSIMYLKGYGFKYWYHGIGALIVTLVGFGGIGLIWYGYLA